MSKPITHAIALLSGAAQYLLDADEPVLAGLVQAIERSANEAVKGSPRAATRRSVQSQGLELAIATAHRWADRHIAAGRDDLVALAADAYRLGVETGADAIMSDQLSDTEHTALHQGRPDPRLHTYTTTADGTLVRLDS